MEQSSQDKNPLLGQAGNKDENTAIETGRNKYETFLKEAYEEIKSLINEHINDGSVVVDLGCNNGNLEDEIESTKFRCTIYGIEIDQVALKDFRNKKYINNNVEIVEQNANEFLSETEISNADAVLIHAVIHELNDPVDQLAYLDGFFQNARRILKDGGKIILGDLYYDPSVSDEEVEDFMKYQLKMIGHADARNKFILSELLKTKAEEHGFSVEYSNEFRAVKEINRRYYSFVFQKK